MLPLEPLFIRTVMATVAELPEAMSPRTQWIVSTRSKVHPLPWLGTAEIKVKETPDVVMMSSMCVFREVEGPSLLLTET
jgi:hypothetical protein